MEVLEKRLRGRGTDNEDAIMQRLKQAELERQYAETGAHDQVIVNQDRETAWQEFERFCVPDSTT